MRPREAVTVLWSLATLRYAPPAPLAAALVRCGICQKETGVK
jgi:hypothetical protein